MFRAGFAPISLLACTALLVSGAPATGASKGHEPTSDATDAIGQLLLSMEPARAGAGTGAPSQVQPPPAGPRLTYAPAPTLSAADVNALKQAIRLARRGHAEMAVKRCRQIGDGVSRQLVEWLILRADDGPIDFARYAAFIRANPSWPSLDLIRRRAEVRLWTERHEPDAVLAFFSDREPLGSFGKLALARALGARGAAARNYVASAWANHGFSAQLESQVLESFGPLLSGADHRARMDARLYADDFDGAMRAAKRLGAAEVAIVKARIAVVRKADNSAILLSAVPKAARNDPVYLFTRVQWLRRNGRVAEAARLILSAPRDLSGTHGANAWWIERRILVRELLDDGKAQIAYRIARDAASPTKESLHVDQLFTAGWIALRFLRDPHSATQHFARIRQITTHPTSLARGAYWLGRAAAAAGRSGEARQHYATAAQYPTAFYGQLASARLGRREISLRPEPSLDRTRRAALRSVDLVRAVELLYATGNRDLVIPFVADLGRTRDAGLLTFVAEIVAAQKDARAMLTLGRSALANGFALDRSAFPSIGLPKYVPVGPKANRSLVYAVARAESAFNESVISSARAMGLMQVTHATGQTIARRLGIAFDPERLRRDPAYNVQFGSAEIADLVNTYDGNHVLAFVGYNAGRGRVKEWIARYGDPRDTSVDVVDWVERIPFTETRIYVQRVMENLQVYRSRFGEHARLNIDADMRGGRQ